MSDEGVAVPRVVRRARNQALFREVNERIADIASRFDVATEVQAFICECSRLGCTEKVELPAATYARIRDDPTTFLVLAGHEEPDHERVVEQLDGYVIVRSEQAVSEELSREPPLARRSA